MSYLRADNSSEDPNTDCRERLFISAVTQDTKGESGQDYWQGYTGGLLSNGALCKLGSLSPNENMDCSLFLLYAHGSLLPLSRGRVR